MYVMSFIDFVKKPEVESQERKKLSDDLFIHNWEIFTWIDKWYLAAKSLFTVFSAWNDIVNQKIKESAKKLNMHLLDTSLWINNGKLCDIYFTSDWFLALTKNKIKIIPSLNKNAENLYVGNIKYKDIRKQNYTSEWNECYILKIPFNKKHPKTSEYNINLTHIWNGNFTEHAYGDKVEPIK